MSYEYRTKPKAKDGAEAFTFPCMEAELEEHVLKSSKISPALRRIGQQLMKQYGKCRTRDGKQDVIGVKFHRLAFTLILDSRADSTS